MGAGEKESAVDAALMMLGSAYRGDWSDFDGRTLRGQLEELATHLLSDVPFDLVGWAAGEGICPTTGGWAEHCNARVPLPIGHSARERGMTTYGGDNCQHTEAIHAARRPT